MKQVLADFPVPTRLLVVVAALAAIGAAWLAAGMGTALLALGAVAMLSGIAFLWSSVQSLTGEANLSLDEALSFAAPSAEEERKRAVLRALKDLEFERGVGKITEEDYEELSARYRAEAKELLRALEKEQKPDVDKAEALLKKRLEQVALQDEAAEDDAAEDDTAEDEAAEDDAAEDDGALVDEDDILTEQPPIADAEPTEDDALAAATRAPSAAHPTRRCGECNTRNDLDARFCKKCGKPMADDDKQLCHACPAVFDDDLDSCPDCGVAVEDA